MKYANVGIAHLGGLSLVFTSDQSENVHEHLLPAKYYLSIITIRSKPHTRGLCSPAFVYLDVSIRALPVLSLRGPQHACMLVYALEAKLSHVEFEDLERPQPKLVVQRPPCHARFEVYLDTTFIGPLDAPSQQ